ncbi:MAG: FtsW/RodA/SpoVE family cell cycle protein [Bryobacteraceae bacterium]
MARLRTDWILFVTIVAMVGFGLVMVYSASSAVAELHYGEPYRYALMQLLYAVVAFVVLMFFKRYNYRLLNTPAWAFSGLGIVFCLLVVVYFAGSRHRWFEVMGVGLQPSEFAKPALILFLAYLISRRSQAINRGRTLLQALVAVAMLGLTVVIADLGTAMVPVLTALIMLWVAWIKRTYMTRAAMIVAVLAIVAVFSRGYRLGRVISYVDPDYSLIGMVDTHGRIKSYVQRSTSVRDASYQPRQSKIAVGAGGVFGAGLMQGKQKLMFLPEAHTDFIYANVGEELGLWGSTLVLMGFLVILWRGARLFALARDDFGKYLALGVTVSILLQALFNMSVVLNLMPTKGFPLPMISYGGSSLLSTLLCLGMLLSVGEHEG